MPLWIALHLPRLTLEVFKIPRLALANPPVCDADQDRPLVVCDGARVCAMTESASAAGVAVDMRRNSVPLLCADAIIAQRDRPREQQTLWQVALVLLQYSPHVCLNQEFSAIVMVEVAASLRLFGGLRHLCRRIKADLTTLGLTATFGIASNASAASLLTQKNLASTTRNTLRKNNRQLQLCLRQQNLARHLDRIALSHLPSASTWLTWLAGIGCQTLGEIRQLPRAGLQRRCGNAILQALDIAYGERAELHQWLNVPNEFTGRYELPDRLDKAESIFHFCRILLLQLCGWLCKQQLAAQKITFHFEHERGRQAIPATPLELQLANATWHEEHLARLLKERLGHLPLAAAVIAVRLHVAEVVAMQAASDSLFPEPGGNAESQSKLLELLVARLGAENVLQAAPHADHRPEVANQWISAVAPRSKAEAPPFHATRPTWLLVPAKPLSVRQHRPYHGSPLKLLSSAERIEAGWWQGQLVTRDYFIAECSKNIRYWIYRERIGQAQQGEEDALWYLHGVFG